MSLALICLGRDIHGSPRLGLAEGEIKLMKMGIDSCDNDKKLRMMVIVNVIWKRKREGRWSCLKNRNRGIEGGKGGRNLTTLTGFVETIAHHLFFNALFPPLGRKSRPCDH